MRVFQIDYPFFCTSQLRCDREAQSELMTRQFLPPAYLQQDIRSRLNLYIEAASVSML